MRWKSLFVFLFFLAVINASSLRDAVSVSSFHIGPDLLLILLVFFALSCDRQDAILVSFAIGFVADVSSVSMVMGPYTISYGLLGGLISLFRRQVVMRRYIYQSIMLFFAGAAAGMLAEFLVSLKSGAIYIDQYPLVLYTALYSAVIGPLIWLVLRWPLGLFFVEKAGFND